MSSYFAEDLDRATMGLALKRTSALPAADRPDALIEAIVGRKTEGQLDDDTIARARYNSYVRIRESLLAP